MPVGVDEADRRIDAALAAGATSLDLHGLRLTSVPARVRELSGLTELFLDDNYLRELPDWLVALPLTELHLDDNRLRTLPDWMAGLTQLTRLDLNDNRLIELPRWIADLGLTVLYVDDNRVPVLPDWLGSMVELATLGIGRCGLTAVPDWVANLTKLTRLDLEHNHLTELPEWLAGRTGLAKLRLHGNRLTELPRWLGEFALSELYVDDNRLDGLPDWLGGVTSLTKLGAGGLALRTIPAWMADLVGLSRLEINGNRLTELPDWLAGLPQLTELYVQDNRLVALPELPPGLTKLQLDDNLLTGLPEQLGTMTDLTYLGVAGCGLTAVPDWLRNLTNLTNLHLDTNLLTVLPDWLADLTELETLWVNDNQLTELPDRLSELVHLRFLYVDHNQLRGLPNWFGDMAALTSLGIGDCGLSELPPWLGNLTGLETLWLQNNQLGVLPRDFAGLANLTALRLDGNGLRALPEWLGGLTELSVLLINDNQLTELPDWLADLSALTNLSLANNPMTAVDIDFSRLTRLNRLDLYQNKLAEVPDWLVGLANLKYLNLSGNELTTLPRDIHCLTGLTELYLFSNRLTELPSGIGDLTKLETLQLADNSLRELPPEIGRLTGLRYLYLADNQLETLPAEIGELRLLETLYATGNKLTSLPPSITGLTRLIDLQLSDNQLRTLPDSLVELPCLTALLVSGNPLISPPPEITAGGSESVLEFIRERMRGSAAQWLSKLLVVGEGGVGKTSLVKALALESHDPDEPSTHGLLIRDVLIDHPDRKAVRMRLSTWDFGGQQIYHATHQFFLTNRSLFVLLWNSRLGWEQGKLHYWLDIITARAPESPIVLVATHIHGRPVDLPLADLRAKYPMIVASVQVDNATRDGIDELRDLLAGQAAQLPLMGSEWPTTWLAAADALRTMPENHITPARMWEIMAAAGVTNRRQQSFIARALHELGDILYYVDDPELNELVVLRPAWVNDYISKVLDSGEVAAKRGLLSREHLNSLWYDLDKGVREHFLGMMDKYDLSYRIDAARSGDLSLVVERLQWDPPEYDQEWDAVRQQPNAREIKVIYQLNTMPPGIPTWFIARSHRFSKNIHWRTGVLLGHGDGQHLALINADRQHGTVELAVRGPSPVAFFMVLDDGLNLTLERFPGLNITRRVPCPCSQDCPELYDYDNLRARLSRTPPRYEIECHRSGELVSVPELLLGLAPSERDATRTSIDQFAKILEQLGDRMEEQSDFSQRMFLRLQRLAQQQQEARCPSVFAVVPADHRRITSSAFEIHLYCEEPGAWHRLPDGRGMYPVTQPKDWFVKLGPHLQQLLRVLKHAAPLVAPVLGVAVDVLNEQLKSDCDLMKELASQLPKEIRHDRELPGGAATDPGPEAHASTDADFRALKAMLTKLDPDETWGGLSRFDTPEGLTLYLCEEHLAQYRSPGSARRQ